MNWSQGKIICMKKRRSIKESTAPSSTIISIVLFESLLSRLLQKIVFSFPNGRGLFLLVLNIFPNAVYRGQNRAEWIILVLTMELWDISKSCQF